MHRSLVVNHGTVCFQWGSALRQLILFKEQSLEPQKAETELSIGDYLDPTIEMSTNDFDNSNYHTHQYYGSDDGDECCSKGKTAGRIQHL